MKSTLTNMVLVLLTITAIASASVGGVYMLTKEPIKQAEISAKEAALKQVVETFDETTMELMTIDDLELEVYTATQGGEVTGYAVNTATMKGFSGLVRLMVGLTADGTIYNINVLSHNETPGLGSKMTDKDNNLIVSIKDRNINEINWQMKKNGGDINALTAATISSVAYADAVERAMKAYNQVTNQEAECCQEGEDNE